jgi:hypothetical protein
MPDVVSRWHGESLKKPLLARKANELTVCGASLLLRARTIVPQFVTIVAVYVVRAMVSFGSLL